MEITIIDIWLSKLNYGWKIGDAPIYVRKLLKDSIQASLDNLDVKKGRDL